MARPPAGFQSPGISQTRHQDFNFDIEFDPAFEEILGQMMLAAANFALRDGIVVARALARVDTGAMKASVRGEVLRIGPLTIQMDLSAGEGLPDNRALFNEFGTAQGLTAKPFVRPGGDAMSKSFPLRVQEEFIFGASSRKGNFAVGAGRSRGPFEIGKRVIP